MLADVQSANVVGYQQTAAAEGGFKLYAPTFVEVGKDEASMMYTIKPVAVTGEVPNGQTSTYRISLQKLAADGSASVGPYYWKDYTSGSRTYGPGWCTSMGQVAQDIKIAPGEGVFITYPTGCNNCAMQFSGEVKKGNIFYKLRKGFTVVGNATPVQINLNDIIPLADEGFEVPNGQNSATRISVQKLAADGSAAIGPYYWKNYTSGSRTYGPGWCSSMGQAAITTVEIEPGEGLFITCNDEVNAPHVSLKIPGVKLTEDKE